MMFKVTLLITALLSANAERSVKPNGAISSKSKAGKKLLSKARKLNDQGADDFSWIANYDIRYTGCSSLMQVREEGGGDEGLLYTQNLVKFSLCPSDGKCSSCKNGADYVVNMQEFLDVYTEYQMSEKEQKCEYVRESCYCNGYNDEDVCMNQCFTDQGLDYCIEYEGQEAFEVQEYLECGEIEGGNGNGNNNYNYNNGNNNNGQNWYGQYFVGPYCNEKDGYSINLGVFYDEGCSSRASDTSAYSNSNYGIELPFAKESIVNSKCISCMQQDENNNQNYNYNYNNGNNNNNNNYNNGNNNNNNNYYYQQDLQVAEICEGVYEQSAKCEGALENVMYADNSGCEFMNGILPKLEMATRNVARAGQAGASKTFAIMFGVLTVLFASYSAFLYKKLSRGRVSLNSELA